MSRDIQSGAGMAAPGVGDNADFSTPQKNGQKFNLTQARSPQRLKTRQCILHAYFRRWLQRQLASLKIDAFAKGHGPPRCACFP